MRASSGAMRAATALAHWHDFGAWRSSSIAAHVQAHSDFYVGLDLKAKIEGWTRFEPK